MGLFEDNCLPGDASFDDLYGGNQSGFFPEQEHFILEDDGAGTITLKRATFTNAGCGNWNTEVTAEWRVEKLSKAMVALRKGESFKLKAEGDAQTHTFKVSKAWNQSADRLIVDMID